MRWTSRWYSVCASDASGAARSSFFVSLERAVNALNQKVDDKPKAFLHWLFGQAREMFRALVLLCFVVAIVLVVSRVTISVSLAVDGARFDWIAHRIANADHAVASMRRGAVTVTVVGEDAKLPAHAVAAARPYKPPGGWTDSCIFDVHLTFYRREEVIGSVFSCSTLLIFHGTKYREDTGMLSTLAAIPARAAHPEWPRTQAQPPSKP